MSDPKPVKTIALGLLGAAVGGCVGYFAFSWMLKQGLYALVMPPALLGLFAGLFARRRSMVLALICCIAGLGLALFSEWRFFPFIADQSFLFFVTHINDLSGLKKLMLVLGTFCSFSLALRREPKAD